MVAMQGFELHCHKISFQPAGITLFKDINPTLPIFKVCSLLEDLFDQDNALFLLQYGSPLQEQS